MCVPQNFPALSFSSNIFIFHDQKISKGIVHDNRHHGLNFPSTNFLIVQTKVMKKTENFQYQLIFEVACCFQILPNAWKKTLKKNSKNSRESMLDGKNLSFG